MRKKTQAPCLIAVRNRRRVRSTANNCSLLPWFRGMMGRKKERKAAHRVKEKKVLCDHLRGHSSAESIVSRPRSLEKPHPFDLFFLKRRWWCFFNVYVFHFKNSLAVCFLFSIVYVSISFLDVQDNVPESMKQSDFVFSKSFFLIRNANRLRLSLPLSIFIAIS